MKIIVMKANINNIMKNNDNKPMVKPVIMVCNNNGIIILIMTI
jgi:hypothetical protein